MNYSRTFGSKFPSECIDIGSHKDVDDTVISLVNSYNSYVQKNDMNSANALYEQNKTLLQPYILNMSYINYLEEEIYNTGLFAMVSNGFVMSDTEPEVEQSDGSYWFQDY